MLVKLDNFPTNRGENKQMFELPPRSTSMIVHFNSFHFHSIHRTWRFRGHPKTPTCSKRLTCRAKVSSSCANVSTPRVSNFLWGKGGLFFFRMACWGKGKTFQINFEIKQMMGNFKPTITIRFKHKFNHLLGAVWLISDLNQDKIVVMICIKITSLPQKRRNFGVHQPDSRALLLRPLFSRKQPPATMKLSVLSWDRAPS